ncbi:MAG: glyoxalase family protein [Candidatus Nanohaloarchaea archaeon]|jgi:glyoxalase family protein
MTLKVKGLHHFTAIAGNPTENAKFYVNKLGLRMVKKTVNHDAPEMYHLFYGDKKGTPGSGITFFPGMANQQGQPGAGMITELGLRVPERSLEYWKKHLEDEEIDYEKEVWRGTSTLGFSDPDGLSLRLVPVEADDNYASWEDSTVPEKSQIRGMNHVRLSVQRSSGIEPVIRHMGLEAADDDYENIFYDAEDGSCVEIEETTQRGRMGKGSVHHIAFKAGETDEEIEQWRDKLMKIGMRPSPAISRKYFTSTYARTPAGILFEFSSMGPGYTADESVEELGSNFVLPENLQDQREEIIENLPEFREEEINQ